MCNRGATRPIRWPSSIAWRRQTTLPSFPSHGYCTYGMRGYAPHRLAFHNPRLGPGCPRGAILGGAGIGVSARSKYPHEAAQHAAWLTSPDIQSTVYVSARRSAGSAGCMGKPCRRRSYRGGSSPIPSPVPNRPMSGPMPRASMISRTSRRVSCTGLSSDKEMHGLRCAISVRHGVKECGTCRNHPRTRLSHDGEQSGGRGPGLP